MPDVIVPKWGWVQLTIGNAVDVTFANKGGATMLVKGTVGATPPTTTVDAIPYEPRAGEIARPLAQMFPGIAGVNRLYAWGEQDATEATCSHA